MFVFLLRVDRAARSFVALARAIEASCRRMDGLSTALTAIRVIALPALPPARPAVVRRDLRELRIGAYRCRGLFGRKHDWRMRRPPCEPPSEAGPGFLPPFGSRDHSPTKTTDLFAMSHKAQLDMKLPAYPWTARQRRLKAFGRRINRKRARKLAKLQAAA